MQSHYNHTTTPAFSSPAPPSAPAGDVSALPMRAAARVAASARTAAAPKMSTSSSRSALDAACAALHAANARPDGAARAVVAVAGGGSSGIGAWRGHWEGRAAPP
jgi:hypothetical protein